MDDSIIEHFGETCPFRRPANWSRLEKIMGMVEIKEVDCSYLKPVIHSVSACASIDFYILAIDFLIFLVIHVLNLTGLEI